MKASDDKARRTMPESGFGPVGRELFAGPSLELVLRRKFRDRVLEASPYAFSVDPFSPLQVRRALTKAAEFKSALKLGSPGPVTRLARRNGVRYGVTLPFTGDRDLFDASCHVTSGRELRATVVDDTVVITIQAFKCDEVMVPYAIASEIEAIRKMLQAQEAFITEFNRAQAEEWRLFVREKWSAICEMRPFAVRYVEDKASRDRKELLGLYDVLFGDG